MLKRTTARVFILYNFRPCGEFVAGEVLYDGYNPHTHLSMQSCFP